MREKYQFSIIWAMALVGLIWISHFMPSEWVDTPTKSKKETPKSSDKKKIPQAQRQPASKIGSKSIQDIYDCNSPSESCPFPSNDSRQFDWEKNNATAKLIIDTAHELNEAQADQIIGKFINHPSPYLQTAALATLKNQKPSTTYLPYLYELIQTTTSPMVAENALIEILRNQDLNGWDEEGIISIKKSIQYGPSKTSLRVAKVVGTLNNETLNSELQNWIKTLPPRSKKRWLLTRRQHSTSDSN
ncbi:MAG: hypothetical protein CL677_02580 [Bdellovibrionaceae bacterium]|nr:hypothetical protein [Pseudobdellovibrionaceae bacterium]|tara:strand:+ start:274869 stop:275603 length:735 start_codon:yes stop_codon:yes gene_type:complete